MPGIIKAMLSIIRKKYDEAIEAYNEAIRIDPKLCSSLERQRQCSLNSQGKYNESIVAYDEAIRRVDPNYVTAWEIKGVFSMVRANTMSI